MNAANHWSGIGNLGQDPVIHTTGSGKTVTTLSLAVDRAYYKTLPNGSKERVETTEWIPVVLWNRDAELAGKYLQKGSQIAVVGELRSRVYERDDGTKVPVLEVYAEHVKWLSRIKSN